MQTALLVPDDSTLAAVQESYERGLTLAALRRAQSFAPLRSWGGVRSRVIAARIAANAGGPTLALRLAVGAWRADLRNMESAIQYAYETLGRRGPLAAWDLLRDLHVGDAPESAELAALRGRAAAALRDFSTAEKLITQAQELAPRSAWIHLQRAWFLEQLDCVEEALETARAASALHPHPFYRPATQACAHLLQLLDRDEEAIALLQDAMQVLQNAPVAMQLYAILSENGRWSEASATLTQYAALAPLLEHPGDEWLRAQRARVAYHLDQRSEAAALAASLDGTFYQNFARRLEEPPIRPERVQLDIGFVRQHFKTCAPATLAAVARFWRMPSDHVQLAEAMCYDGTPAWQQREWARNNGWHVREFRVTAECARELLLAGLPFAVSAVDATSAHMMAIIGFDRTRDVLLLRDPAQPYVIEWPTGEFLDRYRAFGPRAMIFVPIPEAARLEGIDLPECGLYDHYHEFCRALNAHDRATAVGELARLEQLAPDEALIWQARLDLAYYDANPFEQMRCLDRLLELFPGNATRLLARLDSMQHASREESIRLLGDACRKSGADPALHVALARALSADARRSDEAQRLLHRALRKRPTDWGVLKARADMLWETGLLEQATECYRFAASVDGQREHLYQSWFIACRRTRRTEEALAHLEDRYRRFGAKSDQPALTLAWAWNEMEQPHRAREILHRAMELRPQDGSLALRAASLAASIGEADEAHRHLAAARGKTRENDWRRAQLEIAEQQLDFQSIPEIARGLIQLEPAALDAHSSLARALARREGVGAALRELRQACAAYPHHCGLRRLLVEWSRDAEPAAAVAAARELLQLEPSDAWAHRELALALGRLDRGDEALAAALDAMRIEPNNSYSASTLAQIRRQLGQVAEAREELRRAIAISVDNGYAIDSLLALASNDAERRDDIAFVEGELLRQVVGGDGLLSFLDIARPILEGDKLLEFLRHAHSARPDLWHTWGTLVSQLVHMSRQDEALSLALEASQRFPHLPRIWCDLASVRRRRNEFDEEIASLKRAFELNPGWTYCANALAAGLERSGRAEEAQAVYERALKHSPRDPSLWSASAAVLWRRQLPQEALIAVEQALRIAPHYQDAWDYLCDWAAQCGDANRAANFARALVQDHGGEPRVWRMIARILPASEMEERLAAADRAIQLDRRSVESWDLRAELLAIAERFDEALRTCLEGQSSCPADVHMLAGRRAWIEAQRGRTSDAIGLMREVLAHNRSYSWGWFQLVGWLSETDRFDEAESALEVMRQLWPHDAWVHRQLALVLLKRDDKSSAQAAFGRAFELAPTDVSAAHNLLRIQLQSSDLAGAQATLQTMQLHQPGTYTLAAEIDLRLAQRELGAACRCLELLCRSQDPDPWPVNHALDAFREAMHGDAARRTLSSTLRQPDPNPETAAALIRLLAEGRSFAIAAWTFLRLPPGELRRRAAAPLIQSLAENGRKGIFSWVLWRRAEILSSDDAAWGQVGFALSNFQKLRRVADWMADWRQRANVQPWMLFNYCLALRHVGRYAEADEVARHVTQAWEHRDGASDMHLFLAVEAALGGAVPDARAHLERATARETTVYDQQMLSLARALTDFQSADPAQRRQLFPELRRRLQPHFNADLLSQSLRDARVTFRRAAELFRREGAGDGAWLWAQWNLRWRRILVFGVPLGAATIVMAKINLFYGMAVAAFLATLALSKARE